MEKPKDQTRTGTKDDLDSLAPHLDLTGLTPPPSGTKTPRLPPEANPSSCFWPQRKRLFFVMNLGCVDQVKKGKFGLPNEDSNTMGRPALLPLKQPVPWVTPTSYYPNCSSLGQLGLLLLGLVMMPPNSVVKGHQWKGDCPWGSSVPKRGGQLAAERVRVLGGEMAFPRAWDDVIEPQSKSAQLLH